MGYTKPEVQDTKVIKFITEDKYRFLRHVVLLLGILTILSCSKDVTEYPGSFRYLKVLFVYASLVFMCYVNMNFLVPILFFKGRYLIYFASVFFLVVLSLTTLSNVLDMYFPVDNAFGGQRNHAGRSFFESIVILIPIILVTTMIKLFQRWMRDNQKINELNNIAFNMELNELKNQINPHFLFNMLNGIKSLVRTDPEKATVVIMKLSEFLRYQLYENNEDKAILKSEINFLSNFLDLETLRRDNFSVEVNSNTECKIIKSLFLPPNLFTTFAENAVKHSIDISGAESYVRINFEIDGDKLCFCCVNSKDPNYSSSSNEKNSGLGLGNIKRRLKLLYGDKSTLYIKSTITRYEIKLTIPI